MFVYFQPRVSASITPTQGLCGPILTLTPSLLPAELSYSRCLCSVKHSYLPFASWTSLHPMEIAESMLMERLPSPSLHCRNQPTKHVSRTVVHLPSVYFLVKDRRSSPLRGHNWEVDEQVTWRNSFQHSYFPMSLHYFSIKPKKISISTSGIQGHG